MKNPNVSKSPSTKLKLCLYRLRLQPREKRYSASKEKIGFHQRVQNRGTKELTVYPYQYRQCGYSFTIYL